MATPVEKTYRAVMSRYRRAYPIYDAAAKAYRAMGIGDDEYLAARATFDRVKNEYDAAESALIAERDTQ